MTYYNDTTYLYWNGDLVKAADTKIDLYSQSLHYGYGVFEGIRSYRTMAGETRIFKALEHFNRLKQSAEALNMPYSWTSDSLITATYQLLEKNELQDAYIRPIVLAPANMKFDRNTQSNIAIEVWAMQPFLGESLIRVTSSPFQRPNPRAFPIHAKATGHYVNSILASQEAKARGYDEALLFDMNGYVAEGPGANLFYEKDGILVTPAPGHILPGITRATVMDLARAMHIPVEEKEFTIETLRQADAVFYCGTAAEVIGWQSLDDQPFAIPWNQSLGKKIQEKYKLLVKEAVTSNVAH